MRKLLLFFAMLTVSIGAWAGSSTVTTVGDKSVVTITVSEDPDLSTLEWSLDHGTWVEQIVLTNSLNQNGSVIKFVGDAVNASAVEPIIALKSGNTNYGLENYFQNIVLDFSQITLKGEITSLPAKQGSGFVVTTLIYTEDTELPSWVENSDFLYAFSNASTGTDSYLYATEDMTNLPSGLTVDANKTYHLTGTGVETMKDKLVAEGVPEENIIYTAPLKATITYDAETKVATVNAPAPGLFKKLIKSLSEQYPDGTIFKFDGESVLNAEDLAILAGERDQYNNNTNHNKYYVDLYDIPVATTDIETVIAEAIGQMRANNWQYKGLLLPKDPVTVGTTLIADRDEDSQKLATCSQFVAYNNGTTTVAHVYNTDITATSTYNSNVAAMEAMFELHDEIGTNTTAYLVTTNSTSAVSMTALPSTATRIETINNEMVGTGSGNATIIAYPSAENAFNSVVNTTSIQNTPTERLEIIGAVGSSDLTAIGNFQNGPRVLDLRNATGLTAAMVSAIQNSSIEYLLLPNGWTKEDVNAAANATNMTGLKAAISVSNDAKELVAYINEPGSLAEARSLATGGTTTDGVLYPTAKGLTSVTLSGYLNASDINVDGNVGADGHWGTSGKSNVGLNAEYPTSLDLELAVFPVQEDMNFSKAAKTRDKLTSIILPTSPAMDLIPEDCLNNYQKLTEICIPYNYKYIRSGAFHGTQIDHVTTTDASGALIDNGDHTWTLSANVQELGTEPSTPGAFVGQVFQHDLLVTDLYILATKTPKCYAGVFPANASYGYGGASGSDIYCRDMYYNDPTRQTKAWLVLRFPSEESYNAAKTAGQATDASYEQMQKNYTDVTRVYTKMEQSGAVDANGKSITWPTRQEANRSYNQASRGLIWNAWDPTSGAASQGEDGAIAGGGDPTGAAVGSVASMDGMPETTAGFTFDPDYIGWHQIVLSQATYFEPAEEINEQEEIVRNYEVAGLYTFCIPYDMTIDEVCELMGVPASDDSKKIVNMFDHNKVTKPIMPEIYQLEKVTRYKGSSASDNNIVKFILSKNLTNYQGEPHYLEIDHNTEKVTYTKAGTDHPNRCLVGGRPYIIMAYKRLTETIGKQNLGMYVMTRNADKFDESASCVNNGLYEQLGTGTLKTLQFAIPYEQHKIQAVRPGESAEALSYTDDNDQSHKYYYTMVGQYWEQALPLYCIYMSNGAWYRYTGKTAGYKWGAYKCIIMPTQEINDKGGGYRSDERSQIPNITGTDLLDKEFRLGFLDGRDDDDFKNNQGAKYMFTFDDVDGIIEYDENGNETTSIKQLDGEDLTIGTGKIYNMSGQYVGNSVEGLSRGMYIMNGKKFVVK